MPKVTNADPFAPKKPHTPNKAQESFQKGFNTYADLLKKKKKTESK